MYVNIIYFSLFSAQSSELNEQSTKIALLIRQLKQQERAYVELLERSVVSSMYYDPLASHGIYSLNVKQFQHHLSLKDYRLIYWSVWGWK